MKAFIFVAGYVIIFWILAYVTTRKDS